MKLSPALKSCRYTTSCLYHSSLPKLRVAKPFWEYALFPTRPTSSIPRYSCHFAKFFETVLRAPITNGTSTTCNWCIHRTSKATSWYYLIFQASVVTIFPSSGTAASTCSQWCFSFKTIVTSSLLCGTHLSVIIVLSHARFTWSFSIAGIGLNSYHFSPHSRS